MSKKNTTAVIHSKIQMIGMKTMKEKAVKKDKEKGVKSAGRLPEGLQ